MRDYRDQKACANCKFVVEEEYREYVCGKEPHTRPDLRGVSMTHHTEWRKEIIVWEVCYAVKPEGICDDYEQNE